MVDQSLIDGYLSDLAVALPGPHRWRQSVLDEARDSLLEALETRMRTGADPSDAARQVVDEYGPVPVVVAAFAPEIAAVRAQHAGLFLLLAMPLLAELWYVAVHLHPAVDWHGQNAAVRIAGVLLAVSVAIAVTGSLGSIVCATRGSRAIDVDLEVFRFAVGISGAATTVAILTLLSVMTARAIVAPDSFVIPAVFGAFMTTLLILALVIRIGLRSLGVIKAARLATSLAGGT
jgi:hypothetical protein